MLGANKDEATVATLSLTPEKSDDGASFRCTVWNRAMPEGQRHEGRASIVVNCEFLKT